jgi:trimethylamine:corrinoid methyltransferase-like protein
MPPLNQSALPASNFTYLTGQQQAQIMAACFDIPEYAGVRLFSQEALDLLHKAGLQVEHGNRVCIPAPFVEQAVAMAPHQVTLFNQHGAPVIPIGGYTNSIHYTHSSTLRTIEEIFSITPLLGDASKATDLSDLFKKFP